MNTQFEILIASVFGRGNWLAVELRKAGMNVVLMDLSKSFGHWAPEDWEGPFGIFHPDNMSESQITRLHEEDYMEGIPEGFVVWTRDGVLDTAGPLVQELLQKWAVDTKQVEYLKKPEAGVPTEITDLSFSQNWFSQLSCSLAAPFFVENSGALGMAQALPVFSPHFIRRASRRGYEQNLEWVASKGVRVFDKAKIVDLVGVGKQLQGFEITSDWSGMINAEQFIWCLTSEETEHVSRPIREKMMPAGVVKSEWQWQRYRVHMKGSAIHHEIPLSAVCIEDLGLPWVHENMFILQRATTGSDYDLWLKLPSSQRFHRKYITEKGERALQFLSRRLPGCELEISQWPAETSYDHGDLGPARYPIYAIEDHNRNNKRSVWNNLSFDSPENWPRLDWSGTFAAQNSLKDDLEKWKIKKEEALQKQQQREASR